MEKVNGLKSQAKSHITGVEDAPPFVPQEFGQDSGRTAYLGPQGQVLSRKIWMLGLESS